MSAVAAPADRRFRRARVKPSRSKRRGPSRAWPLLRWVPGVLLVACGLYVGSTGVSRANILRVERIVIRGNERLSEGEVLAVLSGLRGESVISTDLGGWRERLLASPWVREAALRRSLPSTVEVVISERQPTGVARLRDQMYLVDGGGEIIDQYSSRYADLDLPIVDGLSPPESADGLTIDPIRAELAARVAATLKANPDVGRLLSQIDVADVHNAKVILAGDPAVISLGEVQFLERLESYLDFATALRERVVTIDQVDVRFDNRIYVQPASKETRGSRQDP